MEKNIMMVLLFDFPIVLAVGIPAAAIMAFILTNVVVEWFKRADTTPYLWPAEIW
jgi:hypothetical protein